MRAGRGSAPCPRVTVLIPLRDGGAFVERAIDSALGQSFDGLEVLVVDDGSTDDGPRRVADLARRDPRVRLLRRPARGIAAALAAGLDEARGELVARLDADDRMAPSRLARQVAALDRDPSLGLVAARARVIPDRPLGAGMRAYLEWQDRCLTPTDLRDEIYVEAPFAHSSVTFRRRVVLEAGGYREGDFPEDYELWLRLAARGVRMRKLGARLVEWRLRPDSLSRRDPRYSRESFDRIRAEYLARDPRLHRGRALAIWGAGRRTRRRARRLLERGLRPRVWIDVDPRKIGNRVGGVEVVAPHWLPEGARGPERPFVLGYVASHGAREAMAARLRAAGYRRGSDFLMVG